MPSVELPPSIVLKSGSSQMQIKPYIEFLSMFCSNPCTVSDIYSVTITLTPGEHYALKCQKSDAYNLQDLSINYLEYKIDRLQLYHWYFFVQEFTKAGVVHLHGFAIVKDKASLIPDKYYNKQRFHLQYLDHKLECQNVYKPIKNIRQCNAWITYIKKCLVPVTMLDYIKIVT